MKIVQKGNKQLKVADERLDEMLSRGFAEIDQKTGKPIAKKDAKADEIATLKKENAALKKECAELEKENKALKEQLENLPKGTE